MELNHYLQKVSVIGAGGKMGRGIALLLLQEMARVEAEETGAVGKGKYQLLLIDAIEDALHSLRPFLRDHLTKYGEKNIVVLRQYYAKDARLVSNEEIIAAFVNGALEMCHWDTNPERASQTSLIFEAIIEDVEIKADLFHKIAKKNPNVFILSNTSSIPLSILNQKADLHNNIIGFHFYNPPAIQKLVEIIVYEGLNTTLKEISFQIAKRLNKIVVESRDVAGFIGNGHFLREIVFACQQVEHLSKEHPLEEAIYMVNRVTQEWLLRPMGTFQLLDYVGIDVGQKIGKIMQNYLHDKSMEIPLIQKMVDLHLVGGQHPDGSQKNGFFLYGKHGIEGIYAFEEKKYIPLANVSWKTNADDLLGKPIEDSISWKALQKDKDRSTHMKTYFQQLYGTDTLGSQLAQEFLENSKNVAELLVKQGVAQNIGDVDKVLINGFYHLYGADTYIGIKELT